MTGEVMKNALLVSLFAILVAISRSQQYYVDVEEGVPPNHSVKNIHIDGATNYAFEEVDNFFLISPTGEILTNGTLDREAMVSLYGEDMKTYTISYSLNNAMSSLSVQISVTDINDNAPQFMNLLPSISISGNQLGPIFKLSAMDPDKGENATVGFSIISGNEEGYFDILPPDPDDNPIYQLSLKHSPQSSGSYPIELEARDQGTKVSKSSSRVVLVNVSIVAIGPPMFVETSYIFTVSKSAQPGKIVGQVNAVSPSSANSNYVIYFFDDGDESYADTLIHFTINETSGEISLKELPTKARASFRVYASYHSEDSEIDVPQASVLVTVDFISDQALQIVLSRDGTVPVPRYQYFMENVPNNSLLAMKIINSEGQPKFSSEISPSNIKGNIEFMIISQFKILEFHIKEKIDREVIPEINITIRANDSTGAIDTVYVTVVILDENDNTPVFTPAVYEISVNESISIGSEIAVVKAYDSDAGSNGTVVYSIVQYEPYAAGDLFLINSSSGTILLTQGLNYESEELKEIHLIINATDGGGRANSTEMIINVIDVNEAPKFLPSVETDVDIYFNTETGGVPIASFTAVDEEGDKIEYSMDCVGLIPTSFLDVNRDTGELFYLNKMNFTDPIHCKVMAKDVRTPPAESRLNITVHFVQNSCASDPCLNSGTCSNVRYGYSCACPSTHFGKLCDTPNDPCYNSPCLNDGICEGVNRSHIYHCHCPHGYGGHNCEQKPFSFERNRHAKFLFPLLDLTSNSASLSFDIFTNDKSGLLFYQKFKNSHLALQLIDKKAMLANVNGILASSSNDIQEDSWNRITIHLENGKFELKVEELVVASRSYDELTVNLTNEANSFSAFAGLESFNEVSVELNLRYYDFIGCLGNIAWNNQAVTIPEGSYTASNQCDPSMNTISPSPLSSVSCVSCQNILVETCEYVSDRLASSCSNDVATFQSYSGQGYTMIRFHKDFFFYSEVLQRGETSETTKRAALTETAFQLTLQFQTSSQNGIILAIFNQKNYHILYLEEGKLNYYISLSSPEFLRRIVLSNPVSDGSLHQVTVTQKDNIVTCTSGGSSGSSTRINDLESIVVHSSLLFIGGLPIDRSDEIKMSNTIIKNLSPFKGCLKDLTVNHIKLSLSESQQQLTNISHSVKALSDAGQCNTQDESFIIYLIIGIPTAVSVLLVSAIVLLIVCCCCVRYRKYKRIFTVNSNSSLGHETASVVAYNDEYGETHPEEEEKRRHSGNEVFHMIQASIESPSLHEAYHFHDHSNTSAETGFHSDMPLPEGSSTDIKDCYSDESTLPLSEGSSSLNATSHHRPPSRALIRKVHSTNRDSITSTEASVMDPLRIRDSQAGVLSPSLEDLTNSNQGNEESDVHDKRHEASPVQPVDMLKSLSAAHVTPNDYWEEAVRMKPSVDTDDRTLGLSQLLSEPYWLMEPPSSSTSVVSSAVENRYGDVTVQGGVEEEAGTEHLSVVTDDTLNYKTNRHHHTPTYNTPPWRPKGNYPHNNRHYPNYLPHPPHGIQPWSPTRHLPSRPGGSHPPSSIRKTKKQAFPQQNSSHKNGTNEGRSPLSLQTVTQQVGENPKQLQNGLEDSVPTLRIPARLVDNHSPRISPRHTEASLSPPSFAEEDTFGSYPRLMHEPPRSPHRHHVDGVRSPSRHVTEGVRSPSRHVTEGVRSPSRHAAEGIRSPNRHAAEGVRSPSRHVTEGVRSPSRHVTEGVRSPSRHAAEGIRSPNRHAAEGVRSPGRHVAERVARSPPGQGSRYFFESPRSKKKTFVSPTQGLEGDVPDYEEMSDSRQIPQRYTGLPSHSPSHQSHKSHGVTAVSPQVSLAALARHESYHPEMPTFDDSFYLPSSHPLMDDNHYPHYQNSYVGHYDNKNKDNFQSGLPQPFEHDSEKSTIDV